MKIGFIGCGNMASAMISGMLKKGLYKKDEIIVSNLTEEGSKRSREKLGVVTTLDNHEVASKILSSALNAGVESIWTSSTIYTRFFTCAGE